MVQFFFSGYEILDAQELGKPRRYVKSL